MYPETQKACGITDGIQDFIYEDMDYGHILEEMFEVPRHRLIAHKDDMDYHIGFPCFARPCPKIPRHGFVDSRVIKNKRELLALWKEVRKQDKNAEIILGPFFKKVPLNAVYVNTGLLSIGPGNDGATGGKHSISFPVAPYKLPERVRVASKLYKKDVAYFEAIEGNGKLNLVQIRGGPKVSATKTDYIPKNMTIKKIVKPHNDLLKWEQDVKKFKAGTVVYGNGHTLASHAAIHCVLNKIPFITSFSPRVGQRIKKARTKTAKVKRSEFRKGVRAGINLCKSFDQGEDFSNLFHYSMSVLHNWAYLRSSEHAGWLLGSASILFGKVCAALIAGEYRHSGSTDYSANRGKNRDKIYHKSLLSGVSAFHSLPKMFSGFHGKVWEDGYGGLSWANCAFFTSKLWSSSVKMFNHKRATIDKKEIVELIGIMNTVANLAHNNGWWLDKILAEEDLDLVANQPGVVAFGMSRLYMDIYKRVRAMKQLSRQLKYNKIKDPAFVGKNGTRYWLQVEYPEREFVCAIMAPEDSCIHNYKDIAYSSKEYAALKKRYKRKNIQLWNKITIPVNKDGTFTLGTDKKFSMKKIFGVK